MSDSTAQGVAKVRHWESLFPPDKQLYNDPFAYKMFPGSFFQRWMGTKTIDSLYRFMGLGGFSEMISIRTKWLDTEVLRAVESETSPAKQLVILGAGYDTRGFRLDFCSRGNEDDFTVFEVDQPAVQEKKVSNLSWLSKNDANGKVIQERINAKKVHFVPIDFNKDDLREKLESHEGFRKSTRSIITMEGVTQYIPKEATADTLQKIRSLVSPGSTLLITYVDENRCLRGDDIPCQIGKVVSMARLVGEPWISGWDTISFAAFLEENGYETVSDTTQGDYNGTYLKDAGRMLKNENDLLNMERFVVARIRD